MGSEEDKGLSQLDREGSSLQTWGGSRQESGFQEGRRGGCWRPVDRLGQLRGVLEYRAWGSWGPEGLGRSLRAGRTDGQKILVS